MLNLVLNVSHVFDMKADQRYMYKKDKIACVVSGMISAGKILNMSYLLSSHLFTYEKKQGGDSCYTYL